MGNSAAVQSAFSGGEWSPLARGRFDEPAYKTALAVCFNGLPIETGAWTRRPGTQYCGVTRNGAMGRVIAFDLEEDQPYNMEFTDGFIRFWDGPTLVTTSDDQSVVGISTATPAVVQTINPHGWTTGNTIYLKGLGVGVPTLQNRSLVITVVDTFRFSLVDPLTQTAVDGATLGGLSGRHGQPGPGSRHALQLGLMGVAALDPGGGASRSPQRNHTAITRCIDTGGKRQVRSVRAPAD